MHRIYLEPSQLESSIIYITGEPYHYLTRTLRTRPGEVFTAFCGDGLEYLLKIEHINKNTLQASLCEKREVNNETSLFITLFMGTLKASGLEDILQPLVSLGVSEVIPIITARSENRSVQFNSSKLKRIEALIKKASALAHRNKLMRVHQPLNFKGALEQAANYSFSIIFYEQAEEIPLKHHLQKFKSKTLKDGILPQSYKISIDSNSIAVFIGPEGGFEAEEIKLAKEMGVTAASLGKRIFDAKTAPISALSAVLYEFEEL